MSTGLKVALAITIIPKQISGEVLDKIDEYINTIVSSDIKIELMMRLCLISFQVELYEFKNNNK